jgi:methanogenic corrinoid protein MtbC1
MVGGGAITEEFAQEIGADGYRATAPEAVELAVELVGG